MRSLTKKLVNQILVLFQSIFQSFENLENSNLFTSPCWILRIYWISKIYPHVIQRAPLVYFIDNTYMKTRSFLNDQYARVNVRYFIGVLEKPMKRDNARQKSMNDSLYYTTMSIIIYTIYNDKYTIKTYIYSLIYTDIYIHWYICGSWSVFQNLHVTENRQNFKATNINW